MVCKTILHKQMGEKLAVEVDAKFVTKQEQEYEYFYYLVSIGI